MLDSRFDKFENFIFDLDGTLWWWSELVPGAAEVVRELKAHDKQIWYITNNCVLTRAAFVRKLASFRIKTDVSRILNPSLIAVELLKEKSTYVIGEGIIRELKRAKIKLTRKKPEAILVAEDRKINFRKLVLAVNALTAGAEGYKTAYGGTWFISRHKRVPGTGALAAAIEKCARKELEVIGKPSTRMLNLIKSLGLKAEKTILFGDELNSDIAFGNKLGFKTVFVLTGRDTLEDYKHTGANCTPDFILNSVADIIK